MWATLTIAAFVLINVHSLQFSMSRDMPRYIEKALLQKTRYRAMPKQKVRTMSNLTLPEVLDKIKSITEALNRQAKENGFKVDYRLRLLGKQ